MAAAARKDQVLPLFLRNVRLAGHSDVVIPVRGTSEAVLPHFASGTFDVVYVDGDHAHSAVSLDVEHCTRLVKEGGYLCGDDLELQIHQVDEQFARQHAEHDFVVDPRTTSEYHPGVTLAVGDRFGEVTVEHGFWALQRAGERWIKVDLALEAGEES